MAYSKHLVAGLEWMWGEGFLSPGGINEVELIVQNVDLSNKRVLDIGCGIGGIDRLLITHFNAAHVTGIDVEPELVERARADARAAGLKERIEIMLSTEGVLEFGNESFDIVFSKDSIIHIKNKQLIFDEILRVLRCGGVLAGSDWLGSNTTDTSPLVREWLEISGLDFQFITASKLRTCMESAGFKSIRLRDRNEWYKQAVRDEIEKVSGENRQAFVKIVGEERAADRLRSSSAKLKVVDAGELRPTHFFAKK